MFRANDLFVTPGEVACDKNGRLSPGFTKKWNAFVRAMQAIGKPSGRGVRRRELPDGVIVSYDVRATVNESIAFRISSSEGESETLVTVGFGLVGGIEPQIDGKPISESDELNNPPALKVLPSDFDQQGRCRLYFKVSLNKDWTLKEVTAVASSTLPEAAPYTGYKLLGLLTKTGVVQCAKRNLGHATSERRDNGNAKHWFWAT